MKQSGITASSISFIMFIAMLTGPVTSCKKKTDSEYNTEIEALINEGKHAEAVRLADESIVKYPSSPGLYYNRGWCYLGKDPNRARGDFLMCLKIDPKNSNCHKGIAAVMAITGNFDEARTNFVRAIELTGDKKRKATIYSNMAKMNLDYEGDLDRAIENLRKAIELFDTGDFYYDLGMAYYRKKDPKTAVDLWLQATGSREFVEKQFRHKINNQLALHYYRERNYSEAMRFNNAALSLAPEEKSYLDLKKNIERNL